MQTLRTNDLRVEMNINIRYLRNICSDQFHKFWLTEHLSNGLPLNHPRP